MKTQKQHEYRQDPISNEWVVVAGKRLDRPNNFKTITTPETKTDLSAVVDPLQPIVEERAEDEVVNMVLRDADGVGQVYNVMNKFPLVSGEGTFDDTDEGPYQSYSGYGSHELFVYREADQPIRDFSVKKMDMMFEAFQKRSLEVMHDRTIRYVFVFHNHGKQAGATLKHPHSQLVASPIVPDGVERMVAGAEQYYVSNKRSVFSSIIDHERDKSTRVVAENDDFIALAPYASKTAFEVEILPKEHKPQFAFITPEERLQLAEMYKHVLEAQYRVLGEVDYNMYIYTAPCDGKDYRSFRWFVRLSPRVSIWGGYESGADMDVCTVFPEDAASLLRGDKK